MASAEVLSEQALPVGPSYKLGQLVRYALQLGTIGFGGPVALVGYMHRDLVERRKWISEAEFKEGLTLAQLMPGPLAANDRRNEPRFTSLNNTPPEKFPPLAI